MTGGLLPRAQIVHSMRGRARLRIADKRGDEAFFASLATALSTISGVYKVDVTPLTGSVLIQHQGPFNLIGIAARNTGIFAVFDAPPESNEAPSIEFDPKLLLLLALVGAALWQMSRDKIFPPAITLFWYALHLGGSLASLGDDAE